MLVTRVNGTNNGRVYTVNSGGQATVVTGTQTNTPPTPPSMTTMFALPAGAMSYGVEINPSTGGLRITTDNRGNIEVNLQTLQVSNSGALNQTTPIISSEAYTNNFDGATGTRLFAIDYNNDSLMVQGKDTPNDGQLFDVRALGTDIFSSGGFEVLGGADGLAIVAAQVEGDTAPDAFSTLFRANIDPAGTGSVLTSVGTIGRPGATPAQADTRVIVNAIASRFPPP